VIVGHVKAISRGQTPFMRDLSGSTKAIKPNIEVSDIDIEEFVESIVDEFDDLGR
jgi:hypothetical protein